MSCRRPLWLGCFCATTHANIVEKAYGDLAHFIQVGDLVAIEQALLGLHKNSRLIVRRHYQPIHFQCAVDRHASHFESFFQECDLVLWTIDCQQWDVLPLLLKYGYDINRPTLCQRYTCNCPPKKTKSKRKERTYGKFWNRGKCTYQSALDYYFASAFEYMSLSNALGGGRHHRGPTLCGGHLPELPGANHNNNSSAAENVCHTVKNPSAPYFAKMKNLLRRGVDVHRIDSVLFFNVLALKFDQYLSQYYSSSTCLLTLPDVPHVVEDFTELNVVKRLIKHGFSQLDCMEFLHPCCNFFAILFCLLCHPRIPTTANTSSMVAVLTVPHNIRQTALLLVNLMALRCKLPSVGEFKEVLENLPLRKVYSKRYPNHRETFNIRLRRLHRQCFETLNSGPLPLQVLTRNVIRRRIGGVNFLAKVKRLPLPQKMKHFVSYVRPSDFHYLPFPPRLLILAGDMGRRLEINSDAFSLSSQVSYGMYGVLEASVGSASSPEATVTEEPVVSAAVVS